MTKIKLVNAAELARTSHYSPPAISAWTRAKIIKRTNGLYDLAASLVAIREHEKNRASDGGRDRGELSHLRAEKLKRQIALLDVEIEKARRDSPDTKLPIAELRRAFSMLILGVRLQLSQYGHCIANDALIAGILPILSNPQDQWLFDQIQADVWSWINNSDEQIAADLKLYLEVTRKKSHPAPVAVVPAPATGNTTGTK